MAMRFVHPRLMLWGGNAITDHNRDSLDIEVERIEQAQRMANGTLRKYVVADKRKFSTSWEMVPSKARYTVDGFWGAEEIEQFYNLTPGQFVLKLAFSDGHEENYNVVISSFGKTLVKRGIYDMYNVEIEMEEV